VRKAPTIRSTVTLVVVFGAVMLSVAVSAVALVRATGHAGLGPLAWLLPLAGVVVVCGIGLMLIDDGSRGEESKTADGDLQDCPACGREVSGDWRLCPWCGDRLAMRGRERAA
jgi:hypothetical protein